MCPGPPVGKLTAHKDAKRKTFYTIEGHDPICMVGEFGKKDATTRMSETFLDEHLPLWEMWVVKKLLSWTSCRRWQRIIQNTFIKTLHLEKWKLDSHGLPVQLLPNKYPTSPAEMEHKANIQQCHPCHKAIPLSQKSAASGAAGTQDKELRDTIETAKSDFLG